VILGFIFCTFTLIAGVIWANEPWGRYWGFGWRRTKSAGLSLIEFAAVLFTFAIVNLFFKGLHAYSGIS